MPIDWSSFAALVARPQRFIVTTHVRPDGDALGSEIGMAGILRSLGKDVAIVNASLTPPRYDFLDPDNTRFVPFGDPRAAPCLAAADAVVILDLSSWSQLAEMAGFVREFRGTRIVVDHHVSEDDLGAHMFKDTSSEATGILVQRCAAALGVRLDQEMATGLLTALAMDTGWFRHPATSASTFRAAAELLDSGCDINQVYRQLYERNTLGRLRMFGAALAGLRLDLDGRLAYTVVTRDDFIRTGGVPPDTEDLVDATVSLRGVDVGLLFIEQPRGGVKVSLRARGDIDVAAIAQKFGGGGHRAAAGANLPDPLSGHLPRVLAAVRAALAEETERLPKT